jgi:hypothetical protein
MDEEAVRFLFHCLSSYEQAEGTDGFSEEDLFEKNICCRRKDFSGAPAQGRQGDGPVL